MIKKDLLIIIPARAGSTGVRNKNIKKINKEPLVYYSCRFAKKVKGKNDIVIGCTDSKKIQKIFTKYKIYTPFLRPKKISNKFSLDIEYVNYCINFFSNRGIHFKSGVILRPTSPIRYIDDFRKAKKIFLKNRTTSSLRSVCDPPVTPFKMWVQKGSEIVPLIKSKLFEPYNMPRQKLPKVLWQTGTYDFFRILFKNKIQSISGNKILFYYLKNKNNIDVDNLGDFKKLNKILR